MPHLLIDGTSLSTRLKGVGRFTYEVCSRLKNQLPPDWRITILIFEQELPQAVEGFGMELHPIVRCKESVLGLVRLPSVIKELRPDLLLRTSDAVGHRYRIPTVTVCHDIDALILAASDPLPLSRRVTNRLRFFAKRRGLRASQRLLCVSDYIRGFFPETYGVSAERCATLYNGTDYSLVPAPDDPGVSSIVERYGSFIMGIATGDSRENALTLPEIFRHSLESGYSGKLVIAGLDLESPFADLLREEILHHGLEVGREVILLPFFESHDFADLLRHFAAADFYIETSRHEAFGMQLLEAMACGTCCLSTGAGSLEEIGGGFPIVYSNLDLERAGKQLAHAWQKGLHRQVSQDQIDYCRSFSWETCTINLATYLRDVVSS